MAVGGVATTPVGNPVTFMVAVPADPFCAVTVTLTGVPPEPITMATRLVSEPPGVTDTIRDVGVGEGVGGGGLLDAPPPPQDVRNAKQTTNAKAHANLLMAYLDFC